MVFSSFSIMIGSYRHLGAPSFKDCLSQVTNNSVRYLHRETENITTCEPSLEEVSE
jgi:hypothetical protein